MKTPIKEQNLTREMLVENKIFPIEQERYFKDFLDDNLPEIKIGTLTYRAGRVLEEIDPIAFNQGMYDHFDSLKTDRQVFEIDGFYFWKDEIEREFEILEEE